MYKDLIQESGVLHIQGREYRIRYSLNALLYLELRHRPLSEILQTDLRQWTIEDILMLTHAAMCSLPENGPAVRARDFDSVVPSLEELGELIRPADLPLLKLELMAAILKALPDPQPDSHETGAAFHEGHQRALYVDVMHRPEEEFWSSTLREITRREDAFMEVKGYKEPPMQVKRYADE